MSKTPYKSLPLNLQNNKPNPTRSHQIVIEEEQLKFIQDCIKLGMVVHNDLNNQQDRYGNPIGEFLVNMIEDTLNIPEQIYDYDMVHGYCI